MALRNQPYLPLFVQDFLTDEKLMECSASSVGVYIKLLCILHKQNDYGAMSLKDRDRKSENILNDFAVKIAKFLPWNDDVVFMALDELVAENVLTIDGDRLLQKRMHKDGAISDARSKAGKKGGDMSKLKKECLDGEDLPEDKEVVTDADQDEYVNALVEHYGFSEMKYINQQRSIFNFVKLLRFNGQLSHFADQFKNYHLYKEASKEQKHSFKSFIGTSAEKFQDGLWNSENWLDKLNKLSSNKPKTKMDKLDDVFGTAAQQIKDDFTG